MCFSFQSFNNGLLLNLCFRPYLQWGLFHPSDYRDLKFSSTDMHMTNVILVAYERNTIICLRYSPLRPPWRFLPCPPPRQPFQSSSSSSSHPPHPFQSSPSSSPSSHPPDELFEDFPDDFELLELELELELPQSSSQEGFHPRFLAEAFSTRIKISKKETIRTEAIFI